ncbi:MAG: hypothetical protein KDJ65_40440, partial [Anaerolineae bacterium]|nr:hypothetical protein [Anaerolineae bacterium]
MRTTGANRAPQSDNFNRGTIVFMNNLLNPDNRLFTLARQGKRLPHIVVAILLAFFFIFAAQMIGGFSALGINYVLARLMANPPNLLAPTTALG